MPKDYCFDRNVGNRGRSMFPASKPRTHLCQKHISYVGAEKRLGRAQTLFPEVQSQGKSNGATNE